MVKKRTPQASTSALTKAPSQEQIDAFAAKADSPNIDIQEPLVETLDPNAPRSFKAIRVPFNEYEYNQLVQDVKLSGRSKLNHIRYALHRLSMELNDKGR